MIIKVFVDAARKDTIARVVHTEKKRAQTELFPELKKVNYESTLAEVAP